MIELTLQEKIDKAIQLDMELKEKKKELDSIKADLQSIALEDMENKNLKWKQLFGSLGSCDVCYKENFDIDNYGLLKELLGVLVDGKVTKKVKVDFEVDTNFKKALIALYKGNFKKHDIYALLINMGLDDKKAKTALKKLRGDYLKDKELLESMGVAGNLEEELDAIKEAKNYDLVTRYFDLNIIDLEKLRKAIWVEDRLSIGLSYQNF